MLRKTTAKKPARKTKAIAVKDSPSQPVLQSVLWRLDRLERQVRTLSELVRDHAEDADRLVKIVGEDHEVLRRELLHEHQTRLRVRRHARETNSKDGLAG
ncbi:MAG: hypothetical protein HY205_05595 [Nitrospirae bacterium]|nr:hypothetical protein [Nitrospirota bacterium]